MRSAQPDHACVATPMASARADDQLTARLAVTRIAGEIGIEREGAGAVGAELEGRSGLFFNGLTEAQANAQAYDQGARERLRTLAVELTGEGRG